MVTTSRRWAASLPLSAPVVSAVRATGSKLSFTVQLYSLELKASAHHSWNLSVHHAGIHHIHQCLALHCNWCTQGVVEKIIDKFIGEISMLGSGDVIRVDQAQLETVIPQVCTLLGGVAGLYAVTEYFR
jgi:hypothetical protein